MDVSNLWYVSHCNNDYEFIEKNQHHAQQIVFNEVN